MVIFTMSEIEQEQIDPEFEDATVYDFVGGSISLVPFHKWEINGKITETTPHIKIVGVNKNGKPVEARIISQNAYDSILLLLESEKGREFKQTLKKSNSLSNNL